MNVLRLAGSVGVVLGVVLMVGWQAEVAAQQRVAVESSAIRESNVAETLLARQVTLNVRDVSLQDAIDRLAASAGVLIQYRTRSVAAYPALVSVQADREPLGTILARLLDRTALRVIPDGPSQLIIVQSRSVVVEDGTITGKVLHAQTKQPIAGAKIVVAGGSAEAVTANDGIFRLSVAAGECVLDVRALGFVRQTKRITVIAGETVSSDFTLMPSASVLNEVIVTGTVVATERRAIGTPITVITAEDIERRGITRIEEFFRGEVPGVLALDRGTDVYDGGGSAMQPAQLDTYGAMSSSRIFSRGSSSIGNEAPVGFAKPTPLKTFVDGVEILDPSYLGTIDPASVERIEIVTGPQAATLYGSGAMGGVMQIFTKKGNNGTTEVKLNLRYGTLQSSLSNGLTPSHNHSLGLTGGSSPLLSYSATLSYRYAGQWQPNLFSRSQGASAGLTHTRDKVVINGSVSVTSGRNGLIVGGLIPASPWIQEGRARGEYALTNEAQYHTQRIATSSGQTLALNVDARPIPSIQVSLNVGRNHTAFANRPESARFSTPSDTLYRTGNTQGQRMTWGGTISSVVPHVGILSTTVVAGVNGSSGESLLTQGCLATKTSTEFLSCWQPGAATGLHVRQPLNVGSWGGFTRVQIGMWERFYATLGLRGEHNRNYGHQRKVDWTPTNQLAYTIEYGDVTLKLLGAYGRATREPSPENRLENITHNTAYQPAQWVSRLANPLLRPEYSRGPEGGFEVYYGSHLSFTLNRYSQRITDLIELVNVDSLEVLRLSDNTTVYVQQSQFLNTASVRQHGWEATGSMNLFWFQVRGTYSWNDSRVLSVNPRQQRLSTQPGQTFRGLPSHMANLQFSFARGATSAVLSTNWVGSSVLLSSGDIVYMRNYYQRLHMYREWVGSYGLYGQFSKPGYAKSDFSMSHRINNSLSATVNITNVGNSTSNDVAAWAPSLGRQTLLGVSIVYPKR